MKFDVMRIGLPKQLFQVHGINKQAGDLQDAVAANAKSDVFGSFTRKPSAKRGHENSPIPMHPDTLS